MRTSVDLDGRTAGAPRWTQLASGSHGATTRPRSSNRREISAGIEPDRNFHRRRLRFVDDEANTTDRRRIDTNDTRVANRRSAREKAPRATVSTHQGVRPHDLSMGDVFFEPDE